MSDRAQIGAVAEAEGPASAAAEGERALAGMANVAALTFLVARAAPGGYWVALAGGVPLARAGQRRGAREGYATAGASLIETIAVMGPARLGIPFPHAASAPLLGVLDRRGAGYLALTAAGAVVRYVYYLVSSAFYIWVLVGLDAYTGTYENVGETLLFLPEGEAAAIWISVLGLAVWSAGAGLIQAWVIRRGLRRWPDEVAAGAERPLEPPRERRARADARAVAGSAAVAIAVALVTTDPLVQVLLAAWLALAWLISGAGARPVVGGLALATPLGISTLAFGLFGGVGTEVALRRAARVMLLVLVAVWLRAAAGPDGLREVSLRLVQRLERVRTLALTAVVLGASAGAADYGASGRRLGARLGATRKRPAPVLDAILDWLAEESGRPSGVAASSPRFLRSARSVALIIAAGLLLVAAILTFALA